MMSDSIYSVLLKSVAFVVDEYEKPCGTAFFISIQDAPPSEVCWNFLVTNKHVIQTIDRDPSGTFNGSTWKKQIKLRLNAKDSGIIFYPINLDTLPEPPIEHRDPRIDLVVLQLFEPLPTSELPMLDVGVILSAKRPDAPPIEEGTDVVNCALLEGFYGSEKNHPICKFGKVALRTDEFWCETNRGHGKELAWIIDLGSEEGSSGSPVFSTPVQTRIGFDGNPKMYVGTFALIGVVKAVSDSRTDYARKMRALTLVEPIDSLQEMFHTVMNRLTTAGYSPQIILRDKIFYPHQS